MEIKKSNNAQLEDKRLTFFLIGLLIAFTLLFVGLQYQRGPQVEDELTEDFEDLAQDLDMQTPPDQKDMVSAEAMSKAPASEAITQEVKPTEQQQVQKAPEKISTTTSELVIGDTAQSILSPWLVSVREDYTRVVLDVPLDSVTRNDALPILVEKFFCARCDESAGADPQRHAGSKPPAVACEGAQPCPGDTRMAGQPCWWPR